jgi:hypothetical protein
MAGGTPAVEVSGAKELRKALQRMNADLKDLTAIHKEAGELVAAEARTLVPVLSGALQKSIRSKATKSKARVTAGNRLVPYAGPIHFGWPRHGIDPQPFLYDALDDRREEVIAKYEKGIEALVRRVDRETPG